jgi:hypothetical protein
LILNFKFYDNPGKQLTWLWLLLHLFHNIIIISLSFLHQKFKFKLDQNYTKTLSLSCRRRPTTSIQNRPVFLRIAISPKLEYFSKIWFQIKNPSCSGIRLPKFWLKISIHLREIAIYKSGQLISINWSILNRGCMISQGNNSLLKKIKTKAYK